MKFWVMKKRKDQHTIQTIVIKYLAIAVCFMLAIGLMIPVMSVQAAEEPSGHELHAFYPSNAIFSEKLQSYIDDVDSVSFAWSRIDSEEPGTINTMKGKNDNFSFYYPNDYLSPVEYAKSQGKSIQLNIYMDGSDSSELLPYEEKRGAMVQAIHDYLLTDISDGKGIYYDGVVIDFEGLRNSSIENTAILYDGQPISVYYSSFLAELRVQLKAIDKKLYVAVNPGIYYDGYDYASILDLADRVILMAHDYEPTQKLEKSQVQQYTGYNALEPINSMAPIQLIRQALYEMQTAASDTSQLSKVWLQITFDSAQWRFGVNGENGWEALSSSSLSREGRLTPLYKSIKSRIDNTDGKGKRITYGYNNELQTPYIEYYNSSDQSFNVILYEDSNSIDAKIQAAKEFGLGGISLWSLANVPDYTDAKGKEYHLDGWTTLLDRMSSFDQPTETGQSIHFSDASVEKAVREKLYKPTGKITTTEVKDIYRLKLTAGVKSLKDLKYLTNLEYLDAQQLGIKDISGLGSLTKLRALYLQRNTITDLSTLKKLTKLEILSLNGNGVTSVTSLSGLSKLQELYLRENKITDISPLAKLYGLKVLELGKNGIRKADAVKKLKQLQVLSLDNNKLNDITPLRSLTGLKSLYLQRNQISDITAIATLKNITLLSLNGNKIVDIKPISKLTKLEKLYLKDNRIVGITSLKDLPKLKELYLSGNNITKFSVLNTLLQKNGFLCDFK